MLADELLNLPPEGWKHIAGMSEEELDIYLKDIIDIEPHPDLDPDQVPCGLNDSDVIPKEKRQKKKQDKLDELSDMAVDPNPNNPIKSNRGRGRPKKDKPSTKNIDEEIENIAEELGL